MFENLEQLIKIIRERKNTYLINLILINFLMIKNLVFK